MTPTVYGPASVSSSARAIAALCRYGLQPWLRPGIPVGIQRFLFRTAGPLLARPGTVTTVRQERAGLRENVVTPSGATQKHGVLYLHGGAYVTGGFGVHDALTEWIAHHCAATVWLIDYRLAPEHVYPAPIEDAVRSYRDLLDSGWRAQDIVFAGDSAGGGLCVSTAAALKREGLPMPAGLVLLSPLADLELGSESVKREAANDVLLAERWLRFGAQAYAGNRSLADCSAINEDLSGLPPVLIQAGTDELLADDATRLGRRFEESGVSVQVEVLAGAGHVFHTNASRSVEVDAALQRLGAFANECWRRGLGQ